MHRFLLSGWLVTHLLPGQSLLQLQPLPTTALPINGHPAIVAAGDLDADGDEDMVAAEDTGPVILRRQPAGFVRQTFASGLTSAPQVVAIGDFDNDGRPDLLLGFHPSFFQAFLRLHWGDGSGNFPTGAATDIQFGGNANLAGFAAADVDNDGDLDLVTTTPAGYATPGSLLVRNLGNRSFATAPATQFPAAPQAQSEPFVVDVDGDGWRDVVLVSQDARTRLYWNNGGNFTEATLAQFPLVQLSLRGLAVADFDGDGDRDLVLGGYGGPGVLLRTTGLRQLVTTGGVATDARTLAVQPVDRDGDGDLDLAVFTRDQIHLRNNDGSGAFQAAGWRGACDDVRHVTFVDLDGDGDRDVLRFGLAMPLGPNSAILGAAYTVAPGEFEVVGGSRLPASSGQTGVATGDIDGDGLEDFLVGHAEATGATIQFVTGSGDGVFGFRWANRVGGISNGFFADLNADGRDEYVFTGYDTVNGYLPNNGGTLATTKLPLPIGSPSAQTTSGAAVDMDGDGDRDLLFTLAIGGNYVLRVLMNHPGGFVDESATRVVGPFGTGNYPELFLADLDGDGDKDCWLHSWSDDQVWRNQAGVMTFVAGAFPVNGYGGAEGAFGDFDGDGDLDLKSGAKLLRNQAGVFTLVPNALPNVSGVDTTSAVADIDDDGDLDLTGSGLTLWNQGTGTFVTAAGVLPFGYGAGQGTRIVADFDRDGDADAIAFDGNTNRTSVLINQLRQLRLDGTASPGGAITFRHTTRPGQTALATLTILACSFAAIAPTEVPGLGWLRLDPAQAVLLGPFLQPAAGGTLVHQEPIPANPALLGLFFCAQPLELRGARLRLGNFVSTWLRI